jgi:hypothetical protein
MRGQRHARAAFYPGKDLVPVVQEAGSGQVRKISPPPGFDPQTVTGRYTDYAMW